MTKLSFAIERQPRWETIGKGWPTKDGKSIMISVGNARRVTKADGSQELQEMIGEVVLTPGSKVFVTPSGLSKRDGSDTNPPSHFLKLVPEKEQE